MPGGRALPGCFPGKASDSGRTAATAACSTAFSGFLEPLFALPDRGLIRDSPLGGGSPVAIYAADRSGGF